MIVRARSLTGLALLWALCTFVIMFRRSRNRITFCRSSKLMTRIVSAIGDLRHYKSPFFLPFSGILQTVYSEIAAAPVLQYQRHEIPLAELPRPVGASCCPSLVPAGLVSVDLLPHENPAGAVVLVPGLTGSSDSGFIRRAAALCHQHGNNHLSPQPAAWIETQCWLAGFEVWAYNPR